MLHQAIIFCYDRYIVVSKWGLLSVISFHWLSDCCDITPSKFLFLVEKKNILFYLVSLQSMEELVEQNHLLLVWATLIVFHWFLFDTDCEMYLIVRYEFPGHVVKEILIEEKEIKETKKRTEHLVLIK